MVGMGGGQNPLVAEERALTSPPARPLSEVRMGGGTSGFSRRATRLPEEVDTGGETSLRARQNGERGTWTCGLFDCIGMRFPAD